MLLTAHTEQREHNTTICPPLPEQYHR